MKYQNLYAFDKHLEQSAKGALSHLFLVVSSCSYERKKIVERIVFFLSQGEKPRQFLYREGSEGAAKAAIEELNTGSLFGGEKILYLNGIDKLKKADLSLLTSYLEKPSPSAHLILGASSSKGLAELYLKGKRGLVACDLSEEKPWEQRARLKKMLTDYVAAAKKRLLPDAVEALVEGVGLSLPNLEQEADKLITYTMQKPEISLGDVQTLCLAQRNSLPWELADRLLWGQHWCHGPREGIELGLLLPLFSQIRQQLQHGLAIAALLSRGVSSRDIALHLPQIKPTVLERFLAPPRLQPYSFFKQALSLLFETELLTKNSSLDPGIIFDLFQSKLTVVKHAHSLPSPQSTR